MQVAPLTIAGPMARAGPVLRVVCSTRPIGAPEAHPARRFAATKAGPQAASVQAEGKALAAAAAAPQSALGSTAVALPAGLQGTLLKADYQQQHEQQSSTSKPARAADHKEGGMQDAAPPAKTKRPDRRRRQLAKQRAAAEAAAAAAEAAEAAAGTVVLAPAAAAQFKQQPKPQQRKRKQQPRQGSAAERGSEGGRERQVSITPKAKDLKRWYADVAAAAEQAHAATCTQAATGRKRGSGAAAAASSFAATLQAPMQELLGERLEYVGFEERAFPQLQSLDLAWQQQQQLQAVAGAAADNDAADNDKAASEDAGSENIGRAKAAGSSPSSGMERQRQEHNCTTQAFASWAAEPGMQLPLLASQWHDDAAGWGLGGAGRLLHEAHAAHGWSGAAQEHAQAMIGVYEEFAREAAALPVIAGRRPASRTLPGAAASYTVEAVVGDGQALQVASSHFLADNYSRLLLGGSLAGGLRGPGSGSDEEGEGGQFCQMGGGLQASLLGGMALVHGDDGGLRLPPALAPVQVSIVPLLHYRCERSAMAAQAERLRGALERAGVRVAVDWRRRGPAGVRFGDSERQGVPLRIEVSGIQGLGFQGFIISLRIEVSCTTAHGVL